MSKHTPSHARVSHRRHSFWVLAVVVLCVVAYAFEVGARRTDWDSRAAKTKAEYLYLDGYGLNRENSEGEAFVAFMRRAFECDTADLELQAEYGYLEVAMAGNYEQAVPGLQRMKRYFNAHPEDSQWSKIYAQMCRRVQDYAEVVRVDATLDTLYKNRTEETLQYVDDLVMLYLQGDSTAFHRAMAILDRLEEGVGKEPWVTTRKARAYLVAGDSIAAFEQMSASVRENPASMDRALKAAQFFDICQRPDSARRYYDLACMADTTSGEAIYYRAFFLKEQGDSIAFDREMIRAMKMPDLDIETKNQLLTDYIRDVFLSTTPDSVALIDPKPIDNLFGVLLTQYPLDSSLRSLYGAFLDAIEKYDAAAEQFTYCTELDPGNKKNWASLIMSFINSKRNDEALDAYRRACALFPDDNDFRRGLAACLYDRELYDEVVAQYRIVLDNTDEPREKSLIYGVLGDVYQKTEKTDSVDDCYRLAISLDDGNVNAYNNYAYYLAEQGRDLDKAYEYASLAVLFEPDQATYLDTYAWVLFKQGKYAEAKEQIERAIEKITDGEAIVETLDHAGDICMALGEVDKALEYWNKALQEEPDNEAIHAKVKAAEKKSKHQR